MIYILSGNIETGKTSALLKWTQGRSDVFGILTPRDRNGIRYLLDANTKESFEMQTDLKTADTITVGRYRFLNSAFKNGNEIIEKVLEKNKLGYAIIDELGKLELKSRGFHQSASLVIPKTMHSTDLHLILIIRTNLLVNIITQYKMSNYQFITIEDLHKTGKLF